jgi:hypothetical protein
MLVRASIAAGLTLLALSGCAKFDASLSQQWVDVHLKPDTTMAQVLRIRAACAHVPNVTVVPIPRSEPPVDMVQSIRFNTTGASDANVAELETCLAKYPAVNGVDQQDASDGA